MNDETEVVRPLAERAAWLREELAKAHSFDEAMVVLSMADFATLRKIEPDFYATPAPITQLRERIAQAHLCQISGKQLDHTRKVSPEVVTGWAYGVLREWLPGFTDFCADHGGQYVVGLIGPCPETSGNIYRVVTPDGNDPRDFRVTVNVQQVVN